MQPARIVIPGDFWDTFVYRGRLYLWGMDGTLHVHDWDALVHQLAPDPKDRLPMACAYTRGDFLYTSGDWDLVFDDPEIHSIIAKKLAMIVSPLEVAERVLRATRLGEQDTPFGELHDDLDLHYGKIFALTSRGLYSSAAHLPRGKKNLVSPRPKKLWDGQALSIRAAHKSLAIAAGTDGVFEHDIEFGAEPVQVSQREAETAEWAFASIFAGTRDGRGHLLGYRWHHNEDKELQRVRLREFDGSEIFGDAHRGLTWGAQDKLYLSQAGTIYPVQFTQKGLETWKQDRQYIEDGMPKEHATLPFNHLGEVEVEGRGRLISAGCATFGTILEYDDALVVVQSDGSSIALEGSASRWRIFPKSDRYLNHMHVVYEDRVEIAAFHGDYFVNQDRKIFGFKHRTRPPFMRRPRSASGTARKTSTDLRPDDDILF